MRWLLSLSVFPLHLFPLPLSSPLFSPFLPTLSLFHRVALHQDAIIQDISEEELKALTVEEGPRVLSESCDTSTHTHAVTHTHAHTHTHFDYRSSVQHSAGEEVRGGRKGLIADITGHPGSSPLLRGRKHRH